MYWGKEYRGDSPEVMYAWGDGTGGKRDSSLLYYYIGTERYGIKGYADREPSLLKELEDRGYDLSTLRFSVQKRATTKESP